MEPGSASGSDGDGAGFDLRRWGPLIGIGVVVAVIAAVAVFSGGDDGGEDSEVSDLPSGQALSEDDFARTFADLEEAGIDVDWPDTCDTDRGRLAMPLFFSPECIEPWEGDDNGGATDVGVTEDTIRIAYYQSPPNPIEDFILGAIRNEDTPETNNETMQGYIEMLEAFQQTYGRSVELVPVEGSGSPDDDIAARADAVRIDEELDVFMVWGGPILTDAFADELAAREIPCLGCVTGERNEWLEERAPWIFQLSAGPEQAQDHVAEYLSKQVAGRNAEFAGDEAMQDTERVFGRLYIESDEDSAVLNDRLVEVLGEVDIELVENVAYQLDPARLQEQAASAIARLKEAGVTTVICSCDPVAPSTFTPEATAQEYFPEWLLVGSALTDTTVFARSYDQEQWANAFGISQLSARVDPEVQGAYFVYEWFHGEPAPSQATSGVILPLPLTFYNVVAALGPDLTRAKWAEGLRFGDQTPRSISQPSLNWGDDTVWDYDDYFGIDDFTEIWYDPEIVVPDEVRREEPGAYRYVNGGERFLPGEWPERDTLAFQEDGAIAYYTEAPEGEASPEYPSPAG